MAERDPRHALASRAFTPQPSEINFTPAVRSYIVRLIAEGGTVQDRIKQLGRRCEIAP